MEKPKVSILLVTYKRPQFIAGAIASTQRQTFQDWELIIIDDSENAETEQVAQPLAAKDNRIQYFHRLGKGTIANASNAGLAKAHGELIAILDDDDWWNDDRKLEKQVAFLDSHPDHVGCGGGFIIVNEQGKKTGEIMKPKTDHAIRSLALYANPMANSTTMFRRAANITYDESLPQFADWEFWLHIGMQGKLYNFPEYFLAYRMWDQGTSFSHQTQMANSGFRFVVRYRKHYPGFAGAIILMGIFRVYACFPAAIRKAMNAFLSRLKKTLFSG